MYCLTFCLATLKSRRRIFTLKNKEIRLELPFSFHIKSASDRECPLVWRIF
jgi:hypothetical protein